MTQASGGVLDEAQNAANTKIWVTLSGLPLTIKLDWPFHQSTSGADFWVLHGDIRLEGSDGLHAPVAVNLSQTVREVLPSLEPADTEAPVINALRKEVDRRQIEFLKSGKLLPVPFSSRHYDFKRGQWVFGRATDEAMAEFIRRKVYWQTRLAGSDSREIPRAVGESTALRDDATGKVRLWIADPAEAQYVQTTPAHLLAIAGTLAGQGLMTIDGEYGVATSLLMNQAERFETARRQAVEDLEKKHAYERA
jgi:hypothetical protein